MKIFDRKNEFQFKVRDKHILRHSQSVGSAFFRINIVHLVAHMSTNSKVAVAQLVSARVANAVSKVSLDPTMS